MINLSNVVTAPMFSTYYTVRRTTGRWVNGRVVLDTPVEIQYYGSVQPATNKDLQQLPEGDRQSGTMKFFTKPPNTFYITSENQANDDMVVMSDEIIYNGDIYKITSVKDWTQFGYVRALGYLVRSVQ